MISKRSIIVALIGLNLFLLIAVVSGSYSLPSAMAQRRGASGDYVAVTCRADPNYDVLYIIDLAERALHCFVPDRDRSGHMTYAGVRNLVADFER